MNDAFNTASISFACRWFGTDLLVGHPARRRLRLRKGTGRRLRRPDPRPDRDQDQDQKQTGEHSYPSHITSRLSSVTQLDGRHADPQLAAFGAAGLMYLSVDLDLDQVPFELTSA